MAKGEQEGAQNNGIWQDRQNHSLQGTTYKVDQVMPVDPRINILGQLLAQPPQLPSARLPHLPPPPSLIEGGGMGGGKGGGGGGGKGFFPPLQIREIAPTKDLTHTEHRRHRDPRKACQEYKTWSGSE